MKHIFENLKKYWYFVILILALLVVQAYCDLSLPDYTSNIIDVGIVNGGVEHQMPEFITENSYNSLKLFLNEQETKDWDNKVSKVAESTENIQGTEPDTYIFAGESYVVGENYIKTQEGIYGLEDIEYEFLIEPGEYKIKSGWEEVALEIKYTTGKKKTVKFDEAGQQERMELHVGDEVTAVSLDGQENYLALYKIQQYDE